VEHTLLSETVRKKTAKRPAPRPLRAEGNMMPQLTAVQTRRKTSAATTCERR
jgi:hypothetical protein